MRKTLLFFLVVLLLSLFVLTGMVFYYVRTPPSGLGPSLVFDPPTKDLGVISKSEIQEFTVYLINRGRKPVPLDRIQGSCGCTSISYEQQPIKPGERRAIKVKFSPANFKGPVRKEIAISTKDTVQVVKIFEFTATIK